jgi:type I restriction enzyme, S subunit
MNTELKQYNSYYPVKYDYVDQLPTGWQLLPNIGIFQERIERGYPDEELLSVTIGRGVIKQTELDKKDSSTLDKSKYLLVYPNDLVYSMRFRQGASGYSNYKGIVSPACTVLKPKKGAKYNPRYFYYMFRTEFYKNYVERFAYGIADGQIPLRYVDFKRMYSILPPIEVQNAIVAYLDEKIGEVEKFIQNKEKLIELLGEEKKEFITTSIFKNDIENDSKPLKYWVSKVGSGITPLGGANAYVSEGVYFLRSQNIHFDGLRLDDVAFIPEKTHKKMKSSKVQKNDVLLNITGASIGRCCAIETDIGEVNVNQHVCIIRPKKELNCKFLSYYLASNKMQNLIRTSQDGASREGLNYSEIKNFPIPIIDIEKQEEIVKVIENEVSKINGAISKAKKEISAIQEYRESLITNLITGKIAVPM